MKRIIIASLFLLAVALPIAETEAAFRFDPGGVIAEELQLEDKDARTTTIGIVQEILAYALLGAVVMIIYGGTRYMTSGGNQDTIKHARAVLKWSLLGLVIIIFAYVILVTVVQFTQR